MVSLNKDKALLGPCFLGGGYLRFPQIWDPIINLGCRRDICFPLGSSCSHSATGLSQVLTSEANEGGCCMLFRRMVVVLISYWPIRFANIPIQSQMFEGELNNFALSWSHLKIYEYVIRVVMISLKVVYQCMTATFSASWRIIFTLPLPSKKGNWWGWWIGNEYLCLRKAEKVSMFIFINWYIPQNYNKSNPPHPSTMPYRYHPKK